MANKEQPSLHSIPLEIRRKVYGYIFSDFFFSCNCDMQPQHCGSCSSSHDIVNVLRAAPAEGHEKQERRQYSLLGVSTKLRTETLPLIRRFECQLHVIGPTIVIGAPRDCRGRFELPNSFIPIEHLRSLLLDRNLPQLPDFTPLPTLEVVTLPAPQSGAYNVELPCPRT